MRSNNLTCVVLLLVLRPLFTGCRTISTGENVNASERAMTEPPFPTKEPERYQWEVWQNSARGTEKFFLARDGARWRIDSAFGDPNQVTTMHTDKDYVISFAAKVYAEIPATHGFDEREGMVREITLGMINSTETAVFEKLGTDEGITKYKVTIDPAKNIETIVYFDEQAGIPVKKEVFKTDDGGRVLDRSVELKDQKMRVDAALIELPAGFKKVPIEEMKQVLSVGFQ